MYPELIDNKSDGEVTKEVMVEHFPEIKKNTNPYIGKNVHHVLSMMNKKSILVSHFNKTSAHQASRKIIPSVCKKGTLSRSKEQESDNRVFNGNAGSQKTIK